MDSKEQFVNEIINANTFEEFSKFTQTCMDITSIGIDSCSKSRFFSSYGRTIAKIGGNILSDPEQVRNNLVQMLNDELEKSQDIFLTYKLCIAVVLLGGTITCISNSALCVTNLMSWVEEEKITSFELFMGFSFLKGIKLGK